MTITKESFPTGYSICLIGILIALVGRHSISAQPIWTQIESGTAQDLEAISFGDSLRGTAVGSRGGIFRTTDGGLSWNNQYSGTNQPLYDVSFADGDTGTAVGLAVILYTTDGGTTWIKQTVDDPNELGVLNGVSMIDGKTGVIVGTRGFDTLYDQGIVLYTTDGGSFWEPRDLGLWPGCTSVSFSDANTGTLTGVYGGIYRTTDAGLHWQRRDSVDYALQHVQFVNQDVGMVAGVQTLLRTTDGGEHWVQRRADSTDWYIHVSFANPDSGMGVVFPNWDTKPSIVRTTNGGLSWSREYPKYVPLAIAFSTSTTCVVVGRDGQIYRSTNPFEPDNPSAVTAPVIRQVSLDVVPNPFSQRTTIEFSLDQSSDIILTVSNIYGQQVALVVSDVLTAGEHRIQWDSQGLPSGIYICRLDVDDHTGRTRSESRQVVVVR